MPRKKFVLAPDAAARRVDCECYDLNGGAPRCRALLHPDCLAPGKSPLTCKFRKPKQAKKENTDHGKDQVG